MKDYSVRKSPNGQYGVYELGQKPSPQAPSRPNRSSYGAIGGGSSSNQGIMGSLRSSVRNRVSQRPADPTFRNQISPTNPGGQVVPPQAGGRVNPQPFQRPQPRPVMRPPELIQAPWGEGEQEIYNNYYTGLNQMLADMGLGEIDTSTPEGKALWEQRNEAIAAYQAKNPPPPQPKYTTPGEQYKGLSPQYQRQG